MSSPGVLRLDVTRGRRFSLDAYRRDFRERRWALPGRDSWKLERRQHFREPGNASWEAFARGDWQGARRLIEQQRAALREHAREAERHRAPLLRIRVVEQPVTPYVQWELSSLRVRAECGGHVRVVGPEKVRALEDGGPVLPELVVLGGHTLYEVLYDGEGTPCGAVRVTEPGSLARWQQRLAELYAAGEDVRTFTEREIDPLPPPAAQES